MHSNRMLFAAALLAAFAQTASATDAGTAQSIKNGAPKGISETFYACVERASGDLAAQGTCTSTEKKNQDARLNRAYKKLLANLDGNKRESVKIAERSWLDFNAKSVDAELALRGEDKTASIEAALSELLRFCSRANELEKFAFIAGD